MKILGIDPGYERLGWGVLSREHGVYTYIDSGCIRTSKTDSDARRLADLSLKLHTIITHYSPDQAVVESLFFSNNQKTALLVAQARGVILSQLAIEGVKVLERTPPQIKSAVTGDGQADKKAVEKMVRLQIKGIPEDVLDDTIDALAAALS